MGGVDAVHAKAVKNKRKREAAHVLQVENASMGDMVEKEEVNVNEKAEQELRVEPDPELTVPAKRERNQLQLHFKYREILPKGSFKC